MKIADFPGLPVKEIHSEYRKYLTVRCKNRIMQQALADIDYLTVSANYVDIHVGAEIVRTRSTIKDIELKLDPEMFGRIHRHTIVNVLRVAQCQRLAHGDCLITLHHGIALRMSRRYRFRNKALLSLTIAGHKKEVPSERNGPHAD